MSSKYNYTFLKELKEKTTKRRQYCDEIVHHEILFFHPFEKGMIPDNIQVINIRYVYSDGKGDSYTADYLKSENERIELDKALSRFSFLKSN